MTSNPIVPFTPALGITVQTTDGQTVTLQPGQRVEDFLPNPGGRPLPRITAGQPRDSRFPDGSNQIYGIQNDVAVNEDGEQERTKSFIGPLGDSLIVRPVGYTSNRSYMPKFDPNAAETQLPLCRSENFIAPDVAYMGKYSTACCALDPRSAKLVPVCPMAQWGDKDPSTGKGAPPTCNESYVVCVVFEHEGEFITAECYFKGASAASGKTLVQQLRAIELKGLPLYSFPLELSLAEAGIGNTYKGRLILPGLPGMNQGQDDLLPSADLAEVLEIGVQRWGEATKVRQERGARPAQGEEGAAPTQATQSAPQTPPPARPAAPAGQEIRKPAKKPMV